MSGDSIPASAHHGAGNGGLPASRLPGRPAGHTGGSGGGSASGLRVGQRVPARGRVCRVLHLEDSPLDHELALAYLDRAGLRVQSRRVETRDEFTRALGEPWDVVLSDYHLPGFSGLEALALLRQRGMELPFILVSGLIGEDTAVEAMRNGANDYLLKNNLARLAPAVEHAMAATEAQRARAEADRQLAASRQRLSELAQHLQTSVEAERHAIAREIHDDVGGSLTALRFELDWVRRHAAEPAVQQRVASALELLTHATQASQRIMQNLRPAILEQGLVAALQWMAQGFEKRTGARCTFRSSHERMTLPPLVPVVAYRTAQEALTNVSKHAGASRVSMDLSLGRGVLSLEISDNGRGISQTDLAKSNSFGIRGLHERASTVGGWVEVSRGDEGPHGGPYGIGRGTTLILSVPVQSPEDAGTWSGRSRPDDAEEEVWSTRY
ncbi:MAG: response regulator [Rubrivivax sp.]|nr:response regulator [Rubrivivax sp.]